MDIFDKVPLVINHKPPLSIISKFNPYTLKYNPVLRMEDITENICLRTPYLRIMKGHEIYVNKKHLSPPWDAENTEYRQYRLHREMYEENILWMIKEIKANSHSLNSDFDRNYWMKRLKKRIEQEHHNLIEIILDGFEKFIDIEGGYNKLVRNTFIFQPFLFSPEIPIPKDINNEPFTLKEYVSERKPDENSDNNKKLTYYEYFIDPNSTFFSAFGLIPLIDLTDKRLIIFRYLSLEWFNEYKDTTEVRNNFEISYIFPDLFYLWLFRYSLYNLPDNLFLDLKLTILGKEIYTSNEFPEIESAIDFSNFSIDLLTPYNHYDDDFFKINDIDLKKLLTEKLIIIVLANSNKSYRAKKINEICPFDKINEYPLCNHHIFSTNQCKMNDYIRFPPREFERNIVFFQKYLRNEYNKSSNYFYWLYQTIEQDDIYQCRRNINVYLGTIIRKKDDEYHYYDKTEEIIYESPPSEVEKLNIIPWAPFFYSEKWKIDENLERKKNNFYIFKNNNDNFLNELNILFSYFPNKKEINVLLVSSFDEGPLFLLQKQKKALWNIIKHLHFQEEEESNEEFDLRIMKNKLKNNIKRAGIAIFGNEDVKYLK
ncbi:MAG: hypothetical protein ACFFBP_20150 [Promethearchaeota archaeon]